MNIAFAGTLIVLCLAGCANGANMLGLKSAPSLADLKYQGPGNVEVARQNCLNQTRDEAAANAGNAAGHILAGGTAIGSRVEGSPDNLANETNKKNYALMDACMNKAGFTRVGALPPPAPPTQSFDEIMNQKMTAQGYCKDSHGVWALCQK